MLWLFVLLVLGDNFEVGRDEFNVIYCGNQIIRSRDLRSHNSVKISFLGDSLLCLAAIGPREFLVVDRAVSFGRRTPMLFRIDLERKRMGLAGFVWPFIVFCILCAAASVKASRLALRLIDGYVGSHGPRSGNCWRRPVFCEGP